MARVGVMSSGSTASPGRARLAALAVAALAGATAAGTAFGTPDSAEHGPVASADALSDPASSVDATPASLGGEILDEAPAPVTVDAQLVRSVARQVLVEQEREEHLTDVDLVARDVLAMNPADPAEADRLTRDTLLGFGPGGPVVDGPGSDVVPAPPQCPPTARACIDVDGKRAWMVDAGRVTYGPVPVTTGKPGYETARGSHRVLRHVRHDHSIPFDSPMPFSTYFTVSGMAFHEGRLDEPSHGCIHLGHHAAAHFFEQLRVGDEIVAF